MVVILVAGTIPVTVSIGICAVGDEKSVVARMDDGQVLRYREFEAHSESFAFRCRARFGAVLDYKLLQKIRPRDHDVTASGVAP